MPQGVVQPVHSALGERPADGNSIKGLVIQEIIASATAYFGVSFKTKTPVLSQNLGSFPRLTWLTLTLSVLYDNLASFHSVKCE